MNKDTYEKLMREEWESKFLHQYERYISTKTFDKVWDLRNNLYDIFFPLGISDNGIQSVCHVVSELEYTFKDDGELAIAAVLSVEKSDDRVKRLQDYAKSIGLKSNITSIQCFDFFVCRGDSITLTAEQLAPYVNRHRYNYEISSYVCKFFTEQALDKLHALLPFFEEERRICEEEKKNQKSILDSDYFRIRKDNEKRVEEMIVSLP